MEKKGNRRDRFGLMKDILKVVSKEEIGKTQAMYETQTSVLVFNAHIGMLIDAEMINSRRVPVGDRFRIWLSITAKGRTFLELLEKVMAEIEKEGSV